MQLQICTVLQYMQVVLNFGYEHATCTVQKKEVACTNLEIDLRSHPIPRPRIQLSWAKRPRGTAYVSLIRYTQEFCVCVLYAWYERTETVLYLLEKIWRWKKSMSTQNMRKLGMSTQPILSHGIDFEEEISFLQAR